MVQQCLDLLKREDIKNEFKMLLKPVFDFLLYELNPYLYVVVGFVFVLFVMNLAILILLALMFKSHLSSLRNTN